MKKIWQELKNRWNIGFQHDNFRYCIAINVKQPLNDYSRNVLCHSSYSTDLVLSGFQIFTSLQNFLNCWEFTFLEIVKHHMDNFFTNRRHDIFRLNFTAAKTMVKKGHLTKSWLFESIKFSYFLYVLIEIWHKKPQDFPYYPILVK